MVTRPRIPARAAAAALFIWIAAVSPRPGRAQVPYYSTGSGQTATFGYYDPSLPAAKAPDTPLQNFTLPMMPTVGLSEYLAYKSALTSNVQTTFLFPATVVTSPPSVIPRAPAPVSPIAVAPTISFQGIPDTGLDPPSPDIAAGPSDVIMVVNSAIAQYTRTGTLKKTTQFSQWFASVLPTVCPSGLSNCLLYDPMIRYDQLHGRFLFLATAHDFPQQLSYLLLSVSNGATYDSGWKIWTLDARLDGTVQTGNWGDFWRLGFDNVAVYLTGNMYSSLSNAFQYAKIRVVKKSELYNPATTTLTYKDAFNLVNDDAVPTGNPPLNATAASSLCPVHQRGKPTALDARYFVNASARQPANFLTVWRVDDPLAATITLTRSTIRNLRAYNYPAPAPQAGTTSGLDSGDSRVLKAVYRSGFIYTARDTGYADAPITATFDVIDTTPPAGMTATQSWIMNANVFYPAFDVPATTPPGAPLAAASLVYGTTTAADGTTTYPGIAKLKAGEASFSAPISPARWGDYFGGAVDPILGGLWTSGEYGKPALATNGASQWGTWAGYFPWNTSQVPPFLDVPTTSPFFDYINVLSLWNITAGCSSQPYNFCPGDPISRAQMATFIIRSMYGENFTYTTNPYFTDVPPTDPLFKYVQKLRDLNITAGCAANKFCPGDTITRWTAAILIVRAKLGALSGDNFTYPTTALFTDVPAGTVQFPFVQKMSELGITAGCSATQFCPNNPITREQMAVFITRAFLN